MTNLSLIYMHEMVRTMTSSVKPSLEKKRGRNVALAIATSVTTGLGSELEDRLFTNLQTNERETRTWSL